MWVSGGLRVTCTRQGPPFSVSARVGHGSHFLVLAGGGDGFRRSAVTGVMFVYGVCCSRACTNKDFLTMACLVVSVCVFVCYCAHCIIFIFFKSVYEFSDITSMFLRLVLPGSAFSSLELVLKCR
jgi:hypothetical protein